MPIRFNTDLCIKSLHVSCAASDMKCNPDERSAIVTAGSVLTEPHCGSGWTEEDCGPYILHGTIPYKQQQSVRYVMKTNMPMIEDNIATVRNHER